jgi:hypothetical protein
MNEETTKATSVRETVLTRIEAEKVCPRGRFIFWCKDTAVWVLWGGSVVLGAIAIAVTLFAVTQTRFMLHEVTHDSFLGFVAVTVPYLWLVVFVAMTLLAVFNLRCTKRGYRYGVLQIMASSLILSLAGGAFLQIVGVGSLIDSRLGQGMPMYRSQEKVETALWQAPQEGRLLGRQITVATDATSTVLFKDATGVEWNVYVAELSPYDIALLASMEPVRLVGTTSHSTERYFHACATFPGSQKAMGPRELQSERQAFLERMYAHTEQSSELVELTEFVTFAPGTFDPEAMKVCANLAMMHRIEKYMKE